MADDNGTDARTTTMVETGGGGGGGVLAVVLLIIVVLVLLFLFRGQLGLGGSKTTRRGPRQDRRQRQPQLTSKALRGGSASPARRGRGSVGPRPFEFVRANALTGAG